MMNSFYWTQSLLVIFGAILAFFISFPHSQNRGKLIAAVGITASVALFVTNQVVMNKTGKDLDWQLNCWLSPDGVDCPKTALQSSKKGLLIPDPVQSSSEDIYDQAIGYEELGDEVKARNLFEKACEDGSLAACNHVGVIFSKSEYGLIGEKRAIVFFQKACDGSYSIGCNNLAFMYDRGRGGDQDKARARSIYEKSCENGSSTGCYNLGNLWYDGESGLFDKRKALHFFRKACERPINKEMAACSEIGVMFLRGEGGLDINESQARYYFELACDNGNFGGCVNLGYMWEKGQGVVQNYNQALRLYSKACSAGEEKGCSSLKKLSSK